MARGCGQGMRSIFMRNCVVFIQIEESILDCLAWKGDSPLWDYIARDSDLNKTVPPSSEEVALQQQPVNHQHPLGSPLGSPITHPQIRRLAMSMSDGKLVNKKRKLLLFCSNY